MGYLSSIILSARNTKQCGLMYPFFLVVFFELVDKIGHGRRHCTALAGQTARHHKCM